MNPDMRDAFFDQVYNIAKSDPNVVFLTADMGAMSLERFKQDLSRQFINVGIAEQNMVSIAAGLTLGGKKVFIYSIIPFVTLRCYEQIKVDLCCMNLPVTVIGVGAGLAYESDGPTHHAIQDIAAMRALPEMTIFNPSDCVVAKAFAGITYKSTSPSYVRIDKGSFPSLYDEKKTDFGQGLAQLKKGKDVMIIATGVMVHQALKVAEALEAQSVSVAVVDLFRIKPLNTKLLLELTSKAKKIVTLEENSITGGIGTAVAEVLSDSAKFIPLKRIAIPDRHCFDTGKRDALHALCSIDNDSVVKSILQWLSLA
jgi:transketolase